MNPTERNDRRRIVNKCMNAAEALDDYARACRRVGDNHEAEQAEDQASQWRNTAQVWYERLDAEVS